MSYISKDEVLKSYKILTGMHIDPTVQGAVQKISAIRYFLALDRFFVEEQKNCDTRTDNDKNAYIDYVGEICSVCDNLYTTNFYFPLKEHNGDYCTGSNFYSAGQVKVSLATPQTILPYPKRGTHPLFNIQNGVLLRDTSLYINFNGYINTAELKTALIIWLLRNEDLKEGNNITNCLLNVIKKKYSPEMQNILIPKTFSTEVANYNIHFTKEHELINNADIENIFVKKRKIKKTYQHIYFGCPGCGKSHKIKSEVLVGISADNIFRTTFHPDSDYSSFVGSYKPIMDDEVIKYQFVPQTFTNAYIRAWQNPDEAVYLVIEEINRGNCAQIFGDLFQLLDRENGVSVYPIKADADLCTFLEKELKEKGTKGIANGELKLPENLHILATMNTSDQSLFPMDSAFKRRWDWEYIPINYENKISKEFKIVIGEEEYMWVDFLRAVNKKIIEITDSEDKQMGDFFIKSDIDEEAFISKVMFYLWSEVCKDEYHGRSFFRSEGKEFAFGELASNKKTTILEGFMDYLLKENKTDKEE